MNHKYKEYVKIFSLERDITKTSKLIAGCNHPVIIKEPGEYIVYSICNVCLEKKENLTRKLHSLTIFKNGDYKII